jgi:hypothetical protein
LPTELPTVKRPKNINIFQVLVEKNSSQTEDDDARQFTASPPGNPSPANGGIIRCPARRNKTRDAKSFGLGQKAVSMLFQRLAVRK